MKLFMHMAAELRVLRNVTESNIQQVAKTLLRDTGCEPQHNGQGLLWTTERIITVIFLQDSKSVFNGQLTNARE